MSAEPYTMREPCRWCLTDGHEVLVGYIRESGGQDVVRCSRCERACYNAPKTETGKPQRSVRSRPDLKPGQRMRILQRDGSVCLVCGKRAPDVILHIAHMYADRTLSSLGFSDEERIADCLLFTCCEECNLGLGGKDLADQLICRILLARLRDDDGEPNK